ncbi:MAG: heme exporter protein CcmB [Alphaproteobacteria bacterium]|nr:heme exporter protein CcmB [Alphaproteobacteria bacterium]
MSIFFAVLRRDLMLALRSPAESLMTVGFFVIAATLVPFGVGPEPETLARIAAGLVWVMALLAALLSLDRLFQADYEDGSLDLLLLSPGQTEIMVLGKVAAHWLTTGLPLIISVPLLAVFLHLPLEALPALLAAMLLGTPVLSLLGAVGAALALGARRGGALTSLLVLPLFIPVLIFGVAAPEAAVADLAARPHLLILAGLFFGALVLSPWAAAAALRLAAE